MSFLFNSSRQQQRPRPAAPSSVEPASTDSSSFYREIIDRRPALLDERLKVHAKIIEEFNLALLDKMPPDELLKNIRTYVNDYVRSEKLSLNQKEFDIFVEEIMHEMTGYGPIEPLLKDPTINDILINTHKKVYVERFGKLYETEVTFKDEAHLLRIINKIVAGVGRRVDESSPMVDARLPAGSRVNVAIRPIAVDGPMVSIRKFSERPFSMNKLVEIGSITQQMVETLCAAVHGKVSIVVSGGTGSG